MNHRLLTIADVADLLATTERHVKCLYSDGRLPYVKVGHLVRFAPSDVERFLAQNTERARG